MKYLLGVDFGGGASKATLISEYGEIVCTVTSEYPMYFPQVGWAEQNPEEIYQSFVLNVQAILEQSRIAPEDLVALSLDAGTHVAVLLDEHDQIIRPAIYWSDSRSTKQVQALSPYYKEIKQLSFNMPSPVWTLPQLIWIRENAPEDFKRIRRILFLKDYIRYRLTRAFVTDSIEAMGSMLYDVENNEWSRRLCSLCGITPDLLPEIVSPTTIVGEVCEGAAKETGLSPKTKVAAGSTDTVMEVFASGVINPGQATLKMATAGRICVITDKAYVSPMLVTYKHLIPDLWYPGTATKTCAASLRWYRDVFGETFQLIAEAAAKVSPGADGLIFHPYLQGEITPHFDVDLRASFIGASSFHTKGHFNRAVMEGVAFSLRDSMDALKDLKIKLNEPVRIIGGGSKSPVWRQIVADVLDMPVQKVLTDDSSIGSAMLAGVSIGIFESFEHSVEVCVKTGDMVYPNQDHREVYDRNFAFYRRIYRALAPIYKDMNR